MKKVTVLICALPEAVCAYAYGGHSTMSGFAIFTLLLLIASIVLSIVILVRWWKMTKDVEKIREHLTHANPKLTYLVAIGENEQAQKAALVMMVDLLYPIYSDQYNYNKVEDMNKIIADKLPKIQKLGLSVPEYVTSGEKFIDYMNELTGFEVPYKKDSQYFN